MEITERVRQIVSEQLDVYLNDVTLDADFEQDLGASLDVVQVIMACEEQFNLQIPDEEAAELTTTRKLVAYITARVEAENIWPPPPMH